jgi:serine/threonine protein kinase
MIGRTISHYRIIEKLGEGGMGVVCRGGDTKLNHSAALKFLPAASTNEPEARARFTREAQARASPGSGRAPSQSTSN